MPTLCKGKKVSYPRKSRQLAFNGSLQLSNVVAGDYLTGYEPLGLWKPNGLKLMVMSGVERVFYCDNKVFYQLASLSLYYLNGAFGRLVSSDCLAIRDSATHVDTNGSCALFLTSSKLIKAVGITDSAIDSEFQGIASCKGRAFGFKDNLLYFSALDDPLDFEQCFGHGGTITMSDNEKIVKLLVVDDDIYVVLNKSVMKVKLSLDAVDWVVSTVAKSSFDLDGATVLLHDGIIHALSNGKLYCLKNCQWQFLKELDVSNVVQTMSYNGKIHFITDEDVAIYDPTADSFCRISKQFTSMTNNGSLLMFVDGESRGIYTNGEFDITLELVNGRWQKQFSFGGDTVRIDRITLNSNYSVDVSITGDGLTSTSTVGGDNFYYEMATNVKGRQFEIVVEANELNVFVSHLTVHYTITKEV